jgi:hypothetical protein
MAERSVGRPPMYETVEELEKSIDGYFNSLKIYDKDGLPIGDKTPTTSGLALALGYCDRQSLYDQKDRSHEFSCVIKKAITYIEDFHERNIVEGRQPTGSIFWLKNHKWTDKQELEHSGEIGVTIVDDIG